MDLRAIYIVAKHWIFMSKIMGLILKDLPLKLPKKNIIFYYNVIINGGDLLSKLET